MTTRTVQLGALDEVGDAEALFLALPNGETMTAIEARLGTQSFARVNRSAIVHLDQIKEIQPAQHVDYTVVLRDGTKLPLSRSLRGQLERFTGRAN